MQITPDKLQFLLTINSISVDITDNVVNWEDVKIDYNRDDLKGVYIDVTNSIDFDGEAYNLLSNLYETYSFNANAIFVINLRNDVLDGTNSLWTYTELKCVDLDFSTFKKTDYIISLNAKSNSLADLIKSNKGTVYDIPVSDLSPVDFSYDRLKLQNKLAITPTIQDYSLQTSDLSHSIFTIAEGLNILAIEALDSSEILDSNIMYINDNNIVEFKEGIDAYITASFNVVRGVKSDSNIQVGIGVRAGIYDNSVVNTIGSINLTKGASGIFNLPRVKINSSTNGQIILYAYHSLSSNPISDTIDLSDISISIEYTSRDSPVTFKCITLQSILQKLIDKMCGIGYTSTIDTGLTNDIRLASAESIRDFSNAKLHTSFEQFYNSMRAVFGLEYDISGTNINFKTRENIFKDTKSINIEDVTDLSLSVNNSHIYSSLKIGFKKTDYNKVNGKDE